MRIDSNFVKGVAYYIGDGRSSTNRSLSTVNQNIHVIKFFLNWLKKYFKIENIKIKILMNSPNFNENQIKKEYSKKLDLSQDKITSVKMKHQAKPHHKILVEIWANNAQAKKAYDESVKIVKKVCLKNRKLAIEYLKGLMAAEGSPKYNIKSQSRNVHLKMKNEKEIKYLGKLLNEVIGIRSSILKVKNEDKMWLITISGYYELNELNNLDIFEIESTKRERLKKIIISYKRAQTKKGDVDRFYLEKLKFYNVKLEKNLTAPELAKLIERDRTRTIKVLRNLQQKGLIHGQRRKTTGRPFEFQTNKTTSF